MAERKYLVKTPELCEYIYHVMSTTPRTVISELTTQEMSYFKDIRAIRRFADNESLEKTIQLFAKIGIPFFAAFGRRDLLVHTFEEISTQYSSIEKRKALIQAMATNKLFVFCANDVLLYGHMAAQNSHSRVYVLNYDYVMLQQKIANAGMASANQDMKDAASSFEMMSRAILQSILKIDHTQAMVGVHPYELKILLVLFQYQTTYVSSAKIAEALEEGKRVRGVVKTCTSMISKGLIVALPLKDKNNKPTRSYTIAQKGLNAVMPFIANISKKAYYG